MYWSRGNEILQIILWNYDVDTGEKHYILEVLGVCIVTESINIQINNHVPNNSRVSDLKG